MVAKTIALPPGSFPLSGKDCLIILTNQPAASPDPIALDRIRAEQRQHRTWSGYHPGGGAELP